MKFITRIILAVAVLSSAARANTGTIGASIADAVPTTVSGSVYATARWIVLTAGTATVTTEYTSDGFNWKAAPYSTRVDATSANPSTLPWQNTTPIAGSYDTPLPGNTLGFRVRCGTIGTSTVVSVNPGIYVVPGVPVVAVLYDVTEGSIGAGIAAVTQDMSGWNSLQISALSPTTQVWTVRSVDDTGAIVSGVAANFTATSGGSAVFTRLGGGNTTSATVASGGQNVYSNLAKRMQWSLPAGGTVAVGRLRAEASR